MARDVAQEVTDAFIAQLEAGVAPWRKPWSGNGMLPHNAWTKRPYRGINALLTGMTALAKDYTSPAWTTYRAAEQHGGQVRKGEKSTSVVLWKPLKVEDKANPGKEKTIFFMRFYSIFNVEQCDGIEITTEPREPVDVPDALHAIVDGYPSPPSIEWRAQDQAYYSPRTDEIKLPLLQQFRDTQAYAETILHELTHSTGHESRCKRFVSTDYSGHNRHEYAKEELVAEIGASMLMQHAGIPVDMPQMAGYVGNWLAVLQNDKSLIVSAAAKAQRAVDHILGVTPSREGDDA